MISAELQTTMEKILPCQQNLIPVSFKRKVEYKGYFIEEYVNKKKLLAYFMWFKQFNHLYTDYSFDMAIIEEFERQIMEAVNMEKDESNVEADDENLEDNETMEGESEDVDEEMLNSFASLITDKYKEDSEPKTAANKLAFMVLDLGKFFKIILKTI